MMTTIWSGLSDGSLYVIVGLLLTIPMVRCDLINFATPFYIILGSYIAHDLVLNAGWSTIPVLLALLAIGASLGAAQEIFTVRPLGQRHEMHLVTTLGMGIAVEGFILAHWGANPLLQPPFFGGDQPLRLLGGGLLPVDLALMSLAVVATVGLQFAMVRTRWGMLGRAAMIDQVAATLGGVNIPRLRTAAFAFSAALCVAFGLISSAKVGVHYDSGLTLIIYGFAGAAIGGLGSYAGCLIGGLIFGLLQALAARYLGVDYAPLVVFGVFCTVMLVRPTGILGLRQLRAV